MWIVYFFLIFQGCVCESNGSLFGMVIVVVVGGGGGGAGVIVVVGAFRKFCYVFMNFTKFPV